jgi:alpha-galactosidase
MISRLQKTASLAGAVAAVWVMAAGSASAHENGLARTPPMGWNTFNCWSGEYDAQMIKDAAHALAVSGLKDLGYVYVNIDGGWNGRGGTWLPDPEKFPDGIAPLAEYVHSQGLKLGIYIDNGQGREKALASRFASWGVDFLKHDDWGTDLHNPTWRTMRDALLATGRPIVYSIHTGGNDGAADVCNMWRTSGDIDNNWKAVMRCIRTRAAGGNGQPGAWPDPDMLEVGNLDNQTEEITHFSLWCVTSSPLILGNDLRAMYSSVKYILGNSEAIAVNQDTAFAAHPSYGGSGKCVKHTRNMEIWLKTLSGGAKAVVLVNLGTTPATLAVNWSDIRLPSGGAQVRDLWEHRNLGAVTDRYSAEVPGHGCKFLKIAAASQPIPEPSATWVPKPPRLRVAPLSRAGWTITAKAARAYDQAKADPNRLIDNDVRTAYSINPTREGGQWVILDMKSPQTFNAVVCDGDRHGPNIPPYESYSMIHRWEVYASDDGEAWGKPVGTGMWGPRARTALMTFPTRTARYLKVVSTRTDKTSHDVGGWGLEEGVDELYVVNVERASRERK